MQFSYCCLVVPDVPIAIEFYCRAFGCCLRFVTEDKTYGELKTGTTILSFVQTDCAPTPVPYRQVSASDNPMAPVSVGFVCQDPDAAYARAIAAGAVSLHPPQNAPWGQRHALVRDLNGFAVEIANPAPTPPNISETD